MSESFCTISGRGRRSDQADPAAHLEGLLGQALLVKGRHLGQLLRAHHRRHRNRPAAARLQHARRRGDAAGAALHRARGHVLPHQRLAAIMHGLHRQPVVPVERLDDDMTVGAAP